MYKIFIKDETFKDIQLEMYFKHRRNLSTKRLVPLDQMNEDENKSQIYQIVNFSCVDEVSR